MSDTDFNLRYLEESQPSVCIPRIFNNIDEPRIRKVFDQLLLGKIRRIDIIDCKNEKGDKFKRAFIHFDKWFWNEDAQSARKKLIAGKEIKIVYDNPWFWKISANRSSINDKREEIHSQRVISKPHIVFDNQNSNYDEFGRNMIRKEKDVVNNRPEVKRQEVKKLEIKNPNEIKLKRKTIPLNIAPCLPIDIIPIDIIPPLPTPVIINIPLTPPTPPTKTHIYNKQPQIDMEPSVINYGPLLPIPKIKKSKKNTALVPVHVPVKLMTIKPIIKLEKVNEVEEGEIKEENLIEEPLVEMSEEDKKICEELYGDL